MQIDFKQLSARDRYKLVVASVVPRPIALVSTVDLAGIPNVAPYSFFNALCDDPLILAVGINGIKVGSEKDTAQNIQDTGEFVVNLVSEDIAQAMNLSAVSFPPEIDEFEVAGFTHGAGVKVRVPHVVESPISFECREVSTVNLGEGKNIVLGEVLLMHIRDDLIDMEKLYVDTPAAGLIGRMHGAGWYARTTDLFEMPRVADDQASDLIRKLQESKVNR